MNLTNDSQVLVSILINNYNYARFVGDAIDSVLGQTYKNIEVIVVDDGSTDDSRNVIESYGDRVTAIFKRNGGQASAMNAGFAASNGEIICLLDADDLFLPERVSEVVKLFTVNSGIDWVFTESAPIETKELTDTDLSVVFQRVSNCSSSKASPKKIDFRANIKNAEMPHFAPSTSNLCFSKTILEKIFPLPEIKGFSGMAITDIYIKLLAIGLGVGCVTTQELGIYRFHDNFYKTLDPIKKRRMFAEIYTTTGYWMGNRFADFSKMSKKLLARGFGAYLSSDYLRGKSTDADCEAMVANYLEKAPLFTKTEVRFMIAYCLLRWQLKDLVVKFRKPNLMPLNN
ncbi:glycosyltransferase family 2 protein [Leptolyngbya sp. FACHB-321]|uniref:glycosyltransferase family 2 protein n=1 Tax=Leptolyngbya sp. FACHB-321 TaxID=2692807 RepID=UPI0016833C96|nr:glycosyltransferase family 2 protein [Leptolyngbya sp. FACHB-321]MBD2038535.1 glycosyltransferase family 2 protein [Leptolyngbya sp. FACHB-321]